MGSCSRSELSKNKFQRNAEGRIAHFFWPETFPEH